MLSLPSFLRSRPTITSMVFEIPIVVLRVDVLDDVALRDDAVPLMRHVGQDAVLHGRSVTGLPSRLTRPLRVSSSSRPCRRIGSACPPAGAKGSAAARGVTPWGRRGRRRRAARPWFWRPPHGWRSRRAGSALRPRRFSGRHAARARPRVSGRYPCRAAPPAPRPAARSAALLRCAGAIMARLARPSDGPGQDPDQERPKHGHAHGLSLGICRWPNVRLSRIAAERKLNGVIHDGPVRARWIVRLPTTAGWHAGSSPRVAGPADRAGPSAARSGRRSGRPAGRTGARP